MTEPAYADIRLGDGRVALRPWRADDAPLMAAACVDPEIALFCMMPTGYTVELAGDFIADAPRAWAQDGWLHLALTTTDDELPVGAVGVLRYHRPALRQRSAELGYWVMPGDRGRGLARAGVVVIADWAFDALDLRRLAIGTMVANDASRRVARALGFRPEALLRSFRPCGQTRTDCIVYPLLSDEWRGAAVSGRRRGAASGLAARRGAGAGAGERRASATRRRTHPARRDAPAGARRCSRRLPRRDSRAAVGATASR